MKTEEMNTEHGSLKYVAGGNDVMLTEYKGKDIALTLPDTIGGKPVTVIGKKAFLGAKTLQELTLPNCTETIQDWAFASCRSLEKMTLPRRRMNIGQGILKDCHKLRQIMTPEDEAENEENAENREDVSYLLAAAMNKLDAFYLFDLVAAGSEDWLKQWDTRMLSLFKQEDMEGFSKMLLCGEEDYGSRENNPDYYIEQRKRFKVRLAMLRLLHDTGLSPAVKEKLASYLQSHKKGESSEEAWKVVLEEHGDDRQYYRLLLDYECITEENLDAVLEDMGARHTEMKAFLMSRQNAKTEKKDAFAGLEFEV